ncbi:MAG TPA: formylglycine-generating enzyme family protein, partial [Pirellulaceae bacterium]|nr:formylglycine-generating enzyme family protein [Pirellulaceae bacterium]
QYMRLHNIFKKINGAGLRPVTPELEKFVVTAPSNLYDPSFTFQLGEDLKLPAATMSQFAAKQYGKWLSGITGQFYRLPSEVEWEYACRAGTTTAYSFGDDPKLLGEFAWFFGNSKEATHPVGQKKPNPWGLYDMHGNVAEWVLDEYAETAYAKLQGEPRKAGSTIAWPTKLYPRVVRGGCWDDDAERLRSAARRGSHDDDWRAEDPNRPQSPWWFTSQPALGVGFRLVRPLSPAPLDARPKYWDADIESIRDDSNRRIDKDGRGARGIADPQLVPLVEKFSTGK